jgi:hypothetical protein
MGQHVFHPFFIIFFMVITLKMRPRIWLYIEKIIILCSFSDGRSSNGCKF